MDVKKYTEDQANAFFGAKFNNAIFPLLEKKDLTEDEKQEIIALAQAAWLHWKNYSDCSPVNIQRAYYMLGKSYLAVEQLDIARYYALKCMQSTETFKIDMESFDFVYAYELQARIAAYSKDIEACKKYMKKVKEYEGEIKNKEDLKWVQHDIKSGKWYGFKTSN